MDDFEATPAPQRHPDALEDGSLSKSVAKRLERQRLAQGEPDARCQCGWGDTEHLREECSPHEMRRVNRSAATQPPHQDRGKVEQRARELFAEHFSETDPRRGALLLGHNIGDPTMRRALRAITAALTEAKQQGPWEATDAMLDAGVIAAATAVVRGASNRNMVAEVWKEMMRAAPQVEAKRQTGEGDSDG